MLTPEEYYITHNYSFYTTIQHCLDLDYVYEFGVFGGKTMLELLCQAWLKQKPVKHFFGFDCFTGLPNEDKSCKDWTIGNFSCADLFKCPPEECANRVQTLGRLLFPNTNIEIYNTLFNKIEYLDTFKPASFVHIDCDTYESTVTVLEFLYKYQLLKIGTVINYNDFLPPPETFRHGEGLAHNEFTDKYKIKCNNPHTNIFVITEI